MISCREEKNVREKRMFSSPPDRVKGRVAYCEKKLRVQYMWGEKKGGGSLTLLAFHSFLVTPAPLTCTRR